jgi:tetratricopeptide (TPR) repeat protein
MTDRCLKAENFPGVAAAIGLALTIGLSLCPISHASSEASWNTEFQSGLADQGNQNPAKASEHFRKALQLMQNQPHLPTDEESCLRELADSLLLRAKTLEAQQVYQQLLDLLTKRYGAGSAKTSPVLLRLGSIQESLGDHIKAMGFYNRALKLSEKNYGPYSPEFSGKLGKLAGSQSGSFPIAGGSGRSTAKLDNEPGLEASDALQKRLKNYSNLIKQDDDSDQQLINDFDKDVLGSGRNTNSTTIAAGQIPPSTWQKQSTFSLKAQTQASVNEDPEIVLRGINQPTSDQNLSPVYKTMSDTIFNQSHFEKGEDYYKRKIAIDMQALGPDHPSVANDLSGLAVLYVSKQDYKQAEPLLSRALKIYANAWGENNILTINCRTVLATCEFHLGNTDAATTLYRQALSHGQFSLGPNSLETARILNNIAYLSFHQGRLEEARTFYEWALASTEGAVGQKDPLLAACLKDYAQVLRGLGRTAEAGAAESRAEGILSQVQ